MKATKLFILLFCLCSIIESSIYAQPSLSASDKISTNLLPDNFQDWLNHPAFDRSELMAGRYYRFIQFDLMPSALDRRILNEAGIQLLDYIPNNTFVASISTNANKASVASMAIRSISKIDSRYKKSSEIDVLMHAQFRSSNPVKVMVQCHKDVPRGLSLYDLKKVNAEVLNTFDEDHALLLSIHPSNIKELLEFTSVKYVEQLSSSINWEDEAANNFHRINAIASPHRGTRSYSGKGITIAIKDEGAAGTHIDFTGRLDQNAISNTQKSQHSASIIGILAGAGNLDPKVVGVAPDAHLQLWNALDIAKTGIEDEIDFVHLISHSYGEDCNRGYNIQAQIADREIDRSNYLMQIFSAGNSGKESCGYGAGIGYGTITGGTKMSKNSIVVGNLGPDGKLWPTSSRGPTTDGRLKPDLCARGEGQISTNTNNDFSMVGGTSAAAPIVTGILAQLYEAYLIQFPDATTPPSDLIKAALLNTADDLGVPGPDYLYGWGAPNALSAAKVIEEQHFIKANISHGQTQTHKITIPQNAIGLKVMIYWNDAQGSPYAQKALVNDLDLSLIDPTNQTHLPWLLDPSPDALQILSPTQFGHDRLNNIEQISLKQNTGGEFIIQVNGYQVATDNQDYCIVYTYSNQDVSLTYPYGGELLEAGQETTIFWDADGINNAFRLSYSTDKGQSWIPIAKVNADKRSYAWTVPQTFTDQAIIRVERNDKQSQNIVPFQVYKTPTNLEVIKTCPGYARLKWSSVEKAERYIVYKLGDQKMDSLMTIGGNTADVPINSQAEAHWFAVQAVGPNETKSRRSKAINSGTAKEICTAVYDLRILGLQSPASNILLNCFTDPISVDVNIKNEGAAAQKDFKICYQLDLQPTVCETWPGVLPGGAVINYKFDQKISAADGKYRLRVWTEADMDEALYNNELLHEFDLYPSEQYTLPYFENFDAFASCEETDCFVSCSLENGWINNGSESAISWKANAGATITYGTGPEQDQNSGTKSGNYLFLESSGSACNNKDALLISPCFNLTGIEQPVFTFWYHLFGKDAGQLKVELFDGTNWYPNLITPITGDQGNLWHKAKVDLSAFKDKIINIRFSAKTGESYQSDIAIDNISLFNAQAPPITHFSVSQQISCIDHPIQLTDNSYNDPDTWEWTVEPPSVSFINGTTSKSQHPELIFLEHTDYQIQLRTTNQYGQDVHSNPIQISNGFPLPFEEDFEKSKKELKENWLVKNPDERNTWDFSNAIGLDGQSSTVAYFDNHSYDAIGEEDEMELAYIINLENANDPIMQFDLSYTAYDQNHADGLRIVLSDQCARQFDNIIYEKKGSELSTANQRIEGWQPLQTTDWRTETIDLSNFVGTSVAIKFINVNGFGNNLYIDNIIISEKIELPKAIIQASKEQVCTDQLITVSDISFQNSNINHVWNFGNAEPAQAIGPGPHTVLFKGAGEQTISLITSNQLGSSLASKQLTVTNSPIATFSHEQLSGVVHFLNESMYGDSYVWEFGDGSTSNEFSPIHQYGDNASYNVRLTVTNNCTSVIHEEVVVITTSTADIHSTPTFSIYPNPARHQFFIDLQTSQLSKEATIEIFNISGQLVFIQKLSGTRFSEPVKIEPGNFTSGTYQVSIKDASKVYIQRLVIL